MSLFGNTGTSLFGLNTSNTSGYASFDPLEQFLNDHPTPTPSALVHSAARQADLYLPPTNKDYGATVDNPPELSASPHRSSGSMNNQAPAAVMVTPTATPVIVVRAPSNNALLPVSTAPASCNTFSSNDTPRPPLLESTMPSNQNADIRRSTRAVVPSKRSEQLNQIGDSITQLNMSAHPGKENIPPVSTGPPAWVFLAKGHLLSRDLGEDWSICVDTWFALEKMLGFGDTPGTKVRHYICIY